MYGFGRHAEVETLPQLKKKHPIYSCRVGYNRVLSRVGYTGNFGKKPEVKDLPKEWQAYYEVSYANFYVLHPPSQCISLTADPADERTKNGIFSPVG